MIFSLLTTIVNTSWSKDSLKIRENLGPNINSSKNELYPIISADGKTLYFSRCGDSHNLGYSVNKFDFDIWFSEKQDDGSWGPSKNIGAPLNNKGNNYVYSISPDGNSLLLGGEYAGDSTLDRNVSISHKTLNGWSQPKILKIKNYYNNNDYVSFFLCADNNTLILSVERKDSYGQKDIYVSFKLNEDEWSEPMNLGNVVNTEFNEGTPFMAPDMITLYFCSNGHNGFGGMDLFESKRLDSTWRNWSEPENLGPIFNSDGDDAGICFSALGDYAYFISNKNSFGGSDIFQVKIGEKVKPNHVNLVTGFVFKPNTKLPEDARIYYKAIDSNDDWGQARTDPNNGSFNIALLSQKKFRFVAVSDSFISEPIIINTSNIDTANLFNLNIKMMSLAECVERRIVPENLDLISDDILQMTIFSKKTIHFDYNTVPISGAYYPELEYIDRILTKYQNFKLMIIGHTDSLGSWNFNEKLSLKRAKEGKDFLISRQIAPERIIVKGMSYENPIADNSSEAGRAQNRRIEFYILREKSQN